MHYVNMNQGVCSQAVEFDLDENNKLSNVAFFGGCNGNLKAIGKLVEGKDAAEIAGILEGNTCGRRPTSCGDQLARALKAAMSGELAPQA